MQNLFILKSIKTNIFPYVFTISILIISIILGVSVGTSPIPLFVVVKVFLQEVFHINLQNEIDSSIINIVMMIRLPRVILAMLVGASLSIAGAAFQGLLKNPLADPYTLGVSSGASLGAVIVFSFGITISGLGVFTLPAISVIMGMLTILFILSFTKAIDKTYSVESIILTGIIFSSFLSSVMSFLIAFSGEELKQIIRWLMGSVSMRGWEFVKMMLPFTIVGSTLLFINTKEINALSFGESAARNLGVNVKARKITILLGASLLTGAAVASSGTIGFVGLVIPHITRMIWGANHTHLLPLSLINGGSFLILADLAARTLLSPQEIPIGVITAMVGAPVFAFIFIRYRKGQQ